MPETSLGDDYTPISACRSCGSERLAPVIDLGPMPLSDALVSPGSDRSREPKYPLHVVFCEDCSLLQILETVDPRVLFGTDYPYYSSFSDRLVEHARQNVEQIIELTGVDESSLVVEIASNDGYLLQWFAEAGVPVLGVDPAPGPASAASARGIPTLNQFYDLDLAKRMRAEGRAADVIIGNNVLAHVAELNDFVAAMAALLAEDGTIVMEFPYVRDLIEQRQFDTIYHEHHCYFSVRSVQGLFRRHGLQLIRVEHHDIHGGSLRVHFSRHGDRETEVDRLLELEAEAGMDQFDYYRDFGRAVELIRSDLVELLDSLLEDGARLAAYGAAAKGAILVTYCGIADRIEYVVDRNDHKQGLEMPGASIPIVGPPHLVEDPPDYLLMLAWNFKDEIMRQQAAFSESGGRFVIPIPVPTVH